jgi:hypothetical protein
LSLASPARFRNGVLEPLEEGGGVGRGGLLSPRGQRIVTAGQAGSPAADFDAPPVVEVALGIQFRLAWAHGLRTRRGLPSAQARACRVSSRSYA